MSRRRLDSLAPKTKEQKELEEKLKNNELISVDMSLDDFIDSTDNQPSTELIQAELSVQIDDLKKDLNDSNVEVDALNKRISELQEKLSRFINGDIETELEALQEKYDFINMENDGLLLKNANLENEKTKLMKENQELRRKIDTTWNYTTIPNPQHNAPIQYRKSSNGYEDWN